MSELEENFNKLKHALENDYAVIPIKDYLAEQHELGTLRQEVEDLRKSDNVMREYLIEVYELILSRAGAEQKLSPDSVVSFAACLPTKLVIRLEELVNDLKK